MSLCPTWLPTPTTARPVVEETICAEVRPATGAALCGVFLYGGTVVLAPLILCWAVQLWQADSVRTADLRRRRHLLPGTHQGDDRQRLVSGQRPPWPTRRYGLREFPISDGWFHYLLIKLLGWMVPDAAVVFNLFCLLTFPLVTLSALFVLRRLGVSPLIAAVVALLFTFLPFHLLRLGHMFLAAYYFVPLTVLLVVRLYQGRISQARCPYPSFPRSAWNACPDALRPV